MDRRTDIETGFIRLTHPPSQPNDIHFIHHVETHRETITNNTDKLSSVLLHNNLCSYTVMPAHVLSGKIYQLNSLPFASLLAASAFVILPWNQSYASTGSALPLCAVKQQSSQCSSTHSTHFRRQSK